MKANIGRYLKNGKQKVDIKIEPHDTYSLDRTLALIILPMLIQLKETQHGIPSEFAMVGGEDYTDQQSFDFYTDSQREMFEQEGVKRWNDILDKMIWSFEQIVTDNYESQYHYGEAVMGWEKTGEKLLNPLTNKYEEMYEMIDKNPNEHYLDIVGLQEHEKRIQEGLELFGKYYRHLWD